MYIRHCFFRTSTLNVLGDVEAGHLMPVRGNDEDFAEVAFGRCAVGCLGVRNLASHGVFRDFSHGVGASPLYLFGCLTGVKIVSPSLFVVKGNVC